MGKLDDLIILLFKSLDISNNKKLRKKLHLIIKKRALPSLKASNFYMYKMISDELRNQNYKNLLENVVYSKKVLEIGTGVGFLAILASKLGAKSIVSCEWSKDLVDIATENLKNNKVDNVTVINTTSYELDDSIGKFDLIIHELFSTYLFSEKLLLTIKDAKRFLKEDGQFLPGAVKLIARPVSFDNCFNSESTIESCGITIGGLRSIVTDRLVIFPEYEKLISIASNDKEVFKIDFNQEFALRDEAIIDFPFKKGQGLLFFFSYSKDLNSEEFYSFETNRETHWKPLAFISSGKDYKKLKVSYVIDKLLAEPMY